MGLFDYFSKEAATERKRERCRKKLTNMYYQKADRLASAEGAYELAREGDIESIRVLLARFEHLCPSHTIDREEKEYVVELLVSLEDPAVEQIVDYCRKTAKGIYWPIQVLEELWPHDGLQLRRVRRWLHWAVELEGQPQVIQLVELGHDHA